MKNIFVIFVLFSLQVFGSYLIVDDESISETPSTDLVKINFISKNFTPDLQITQTNQTVEIPIYVKTNSTDAIHMNLDSISPLKNSSNETIDTTISFKPNSSDAITISANNDFTIHSGSVNDGTNKVGDIIIKVSNVPALATWGSYNLNPAINAKVKIGSGSYSTTNTLNSTATVAKVAMVNIGDGTSVSGYTTGVDFKDSTIDFGNFTLNVVNTITKYVFVKSNTNGDIALSFDTTQKLKHTSSPTYQIGMSYGYKTTSQSDFSSISNTPFTIYSGKNDSTKVGEMRFSTEALTGSLIAGGYSASIAVTVTAE